MATVRTDQKGEAILRKHANLPRDRLSYVIVEDIMKEDAFNQAVKSDPPFDGVVHTASPIHFDPKDMQKEIIDPAVNGVKGILNAIKVHAPSVKRVVITSSFAAMINPADHPKEYSEKSWNPVRVEESLQDPITAYRASKTYSEQAAWEFMESENPTFELVTICPPLVFGPIISTLR